MKNVALGCTGLSINPLVFGTLPLGPLQASLAPEQVRRIGCMAMMGSRGMMGHE